MVYGYIRVSSDKQTVENQRYEVQKYADSKNIKIDKWIEETISGKVEYKKRKLGKVISRMKKDDVLIASEISRLGRSFYDVMSCLKHCNDKKIKIHTIKDNFELEETLQSKVISFAFSIAAEIERNLISQRTKEALAYLKSIGKHIGRPKGKRSKSKLSDRYDYIFNRLTEGYSLNYISNHCKCHPDTLRKYLIETNLYDTFKCNFDRKSAKHTLRK